MTSKLGFLDPFPHPHPPTAIPTALVFSLSLYPPHHGMSTPPNLSTPLAKIQDNPPIERSQQMITELRYFSASLSSSSTSIISRYAGTCTQPLDRNVAEHISTNLRYSGDSVSYGSSGLSIRRGGDTNVPLVE